MLTFDADKVVRKLTNRLKMRHLLILLRIQQYGSLTRVAEDMATSQPAVTKALAEIESLFGAPLFERSTRGMTPTALGRLALARAQAMVHDLGHLVRDMEAVVSGHAAHLNVGVTPFVSGQILSGAIQGALSNNGLRLTLTLHEGPSEHLLAELRNHSLDIVIGRASAAADLEGLAFEVLRGQQPRLIANRRLAAQLSRHRLDWHELAQLDWILGARGTAIRAQVSNIFLKAGVAPPPPLVESYSAKLTGEIIATHDRAISIVPSDIGEELVRIAGVAIVPYSFGWTLPPVALFTRLVGPQREASALFAQALRHACRSDKSTEEDDGL
jgi:DNA-binding transcriptional LysR family regulator